MSECVSTINLTPSVPGIGSSQADKQMSDFVLLTAELYICYFIMLMYPNNYYLKKWKIINRITVT